MFAYGQVLVYPLKRYFLKLLYATFIKLSADLSRMILKQDHSHSGAGHVPLDNAACHASSPTVTSHVQVPLHAGNSEMIESPVPRVADVDISQTCISRCSSPLPVLTPSTSPSSPAGDAQEPPTLSSPPARDTCNSGSPDASLSVPPAASI